MTPILPAIRVQLIATAVAALALAPRIACAEEDDRPIRLQKPTAIRAAALSYLDLSSFVQSMEGYDGRYDAFAGVTVAHHVLSRLALEGTVGGGGERRRSGLHLGAALRATLASHGNGALTLALGAHSAFLKEYGPMCFGHLEAAFELRTRSGLDFVAGGGLGMALTESREVDGGCGVGRQACRTRIIAGAPGPWVHLEAGWAF